MRSKAGEELLEDLQSILDRLMIVSGQCLLASTDVKSVQQGREYVVQFKPLREMTAKIRAQSPSKLLAEQRVVMLFAHVDKLCINVVDDVNELLVVP